MSYNRAYEAGEKVEVVTYALDGLPKLGPCRTPATVLDVSTQRQVEVHVQPEGFASVYISKNLVTP